MSINTRLATLMTTAAVAGLLAGCTNSDATQPAPTPVKTINDAVNDNTFGNVMKLTLKNGELTPQRADGGEKLPGMDVVNVGALSGAPLGTVLDAILRGHDIGIVMPSGEFEEPTINLVNMKAPGDVVIRRVCEVAKVYCTYRDGVLEVKDRETFIVDLPAVGNMEDTISTTVATLTEGETTVDYTGGALVYTADAEAQRRIERYLDTLRNGRPLIVMDFHIWEVTLNDSQQLGINWEDFSVNGIDALNRGTHDLQLTSDTAFSSVTGGMSLGAVLTGGKLSAAAVADFLGKQGALESRANPQMTFISGSEATFSIGDTIRYFENISLEEEDDGDDRYSTDIAELELGMDITVKGSYENGSVFTALELDLTELTDMKTETLGETRIQLPQESRRTIKNFLRVRPGDSLVLAGLKSDKLERDRAGAPLVEDALLPLHQMSEKTKTEMVMMIEPTVIFFGNTEKTDGGMLIKQEDAVAEVGAAATGDME